MRKSEPESALDMWWAHEQRSGDVVVETEKAGNDHPEEGALDRVETIVVAFKYDDKITVKKRSMYYDHQHEDSGWWSIRTEVEWSRKMSFEEFRESEWWETYLEKTDGCNFDSSWVGSMTLDGSPDDGYVYTTFLVPEYKNVWWCSSEVPTGDTERYEVIVYDEGLVRLSRGEDHTVELTIDEIMDAIELANSMRENGVSVDENGTITIKRGESDAD